MTKREAGLSLVLAILALGPSAAAGDLPVVGSTLSCQGRGTRGRVVCEVEVETRDADLVWVDAVVLEAPPFARPLKVRVPESEASGRTERRARLPIGFVAVELGEGSVVVDARAVVCEGSGGARSCVPVTSKASARLSVGPLQAR